MRKFVPAFICLAFMLFNMMCAAQTEPFTHTKLNLRPASTYKLGHPFEIIYGPDNYLYITEKVGRILRVDTGTGERRVLLDHRSQVYLTITRSSSGSKPATGIGQDGMMGMALHPNFSLGTGQDSIFVAYTHAAGSVRISRFKYNSGVNPTLTNETILISGLPANNDHSTGRMVVGPDNKLYYSCGDLGYNQFAARCNAIRSQLDPTSAELSSSNYSKYAGKILRLNFDGSIPSDNPLFNGVRSHVYSKGHRNPQGLVWEKAATSGNTYPAPLTNGRLYSTEHGPRTDDELNIIEGGKNYGWPYIAGDSDNVNYQYVNWSSSGSCSTTPYSESTIPAGAVVTQEADAPVAIKMQFRKPLLSMHASCGGQSSTVCDAGGTNWMKFATIAPSSVDYYHVQYGMSIPDWYPSLLIPTLRKGVLYRVKLNVTHDGVTTDTIPYFRTYNRYRDIALSPDGLKIYIITDSIGSTSGPSGSGTSTLTDRGAILVYQYAGALLATNDNRVRRNAQYNVNVYPNPASTHINIEVESGLHKPLTYELFDITGKRILAGRFSRNTVRIITSSYRKGIYIIKVVDGYGVNVLMQKVILH